MKNSKKWQVVSNFNLHAGQQFSIDRLITILLKNRGLITKSVQQEFLHPDIARVTSKSVGIHAKNLTKAVGRIQKAIKEKEQIVIYGDYDVDGICATAILWEKLYALGAQVSPYIPHRVDEGYGLSIKGIESIKQQIKNTSLIITVDNGIVAHEAIDFAKDQGIDVIITDHHTLGEKLPNAYAIVHTTKLCGTGIAYIFSREISKKQQFANDHLALVALATVADLVPLTEANRALLVEGLKEIHTTKRPGIIALCREAQIDQRQIGVYEIGHILAPRLNAMGRISSAMDSLRLLCTKDSQRALALAEKLGITNKERQDLTKSLSEHAIRAAREKKSNMLFMYHESYDEGVIGLVAGKLVETYYRPAIVISKGESVSKASARSIAGFNIIDFIREAQHLLINAGGHPMASGLLQIITTDPEVLESVNKLEQRAAVKVNGVVKKRGEKYVNPDIPTGEIELEAEKVEILSLPETLPFDMGGKDLQLELPTLLDFRSLTLKHETQRDIFKIQATVAEEFRNAAKTLGCTEVFVPTIAAGASEGGADVFVVDYYGHKAYMTQSPQLYKQMMVGVFERVYTIAHAYRAEPSVTTRHLSEVTMMDIEIAFIESFEELLDAFEYVGTTIVKNVSEKHKDILKELAIKTPLVPTKVPRLTLRTAQAIIQKRTGRDVSKELDLNPEDEKEICEWAVEEHKSDFVTITHYPTKKRAFYTYPDPENPEYSLSYDLLFRGVEILSGSRRINDYKQLLQIMKERGVDPKNFGMYIQAFKYGMPPEGGFSFGLERLTMKLLELANIRQAALFPRDMERIDERLSTLSEKSKDTK